MIKLLRPTFTFQHKYLYPTFVPQASSKPVSPKGMIMLMMLAQLPEVWKWKKFKFVYTLLREGIRLTWVDKNSLISFSNMCRKRYIPTVPLVSKYPIIAALVLYNESNHHTKITFTNVIFVWWLLSLYKTRVAIIVMDYIPGGREQINFNS